MLMRLRLAIVLYLVSATVLPNRRLGAQRSGRRCRPYAWSAPRTLTMADGRPVYVDGARPVRFGDGLALLGVPTFVWSTPTVFADTGAGAREMVDPSRLAGVLRAPGRATDLVSMPTGATRMLAVHALSRGDGSLDVFWGESADTSSHALEQVQAVWHARFARNGWNTPERVLAFEEIAWNTGYPVVRTIAGAPALAVPVRQARLSGDTLGIMYLRRDHGAWRRAWIPAGPIPPTDLALATTSDHTLVLAFVGSMVLPSGRLEASGVFIVRSHDLGVTWSPPRSVADLGLAGVNWLRMVAMRDGTLHLVWTVHRTAAGARPARTIERASSRDGGATWQPARATVNDPFVEFLAAARLHDSLFFAGRYHDGHQLAVSAVGDDGPIAWQRLPFDAADTPPRLTPWGPDSLMLSWGTRRQGAYPLFPGLPAPLLETSTITTRCDPAP